MNNTTSIHSSVHIGIVIHWYTLLYNMLNVECPVHEKMFNSVFNFKLSLYILFNGTYSDSIGCGRCKSCFANANVNCRILACHGTSSSSAQTRWTQ